MDMISSISSAKRRPVDPDFNNVSLLLPFNGPGSTTFTDFSKNAFAVSRFGTPTISTVQSKWGGASAVFNNNNDYLTLANNSAFHIVTGNPWTVEAWVYIREAGRVQYIMRHQHTGGYASGGWVLAVNAVGSLFFSFGDGTSERVPSLVVSPPVYTTNTWHHVCAANDGTALRVYLDGALVRESFVLASVVGGAGNTNLFIARDPGDTINRWFNGYIDDIRITKGVARYTGPFTPPQAPFPVK